MANDPNGPTPNWQSWAEWAKKWWWIFPVGLLILVLL